MKIWFYMKNDQVSITFCSWVGPIFNRKGWWWFNVPNLTFFTPPKGKMNSSGYFPHGNNKNVFFQMCFKLISNVWPEMSLELMRVFELFLSNHLWIVTASFSCFQTYSEKLCWVTSFKQERSENVTELNSIQ